MKSYLTLKEGSLFYIPEEKMPKLSDLSDVESNAVSFMGALVNQEKIKQAIKEAKIKVVQEDRDEVTGEIVKANLFTMTGPPHEYIKQGEVYEVPLGFEVKEGKHHTWKCNCGCLNRIDIGTCARCRGGFHKDFMTYGGGQLAYIRREEKPDFAKMFKKSLLFSNPNANAAIVKREREDAAEEKRLIEMLKTPADKLCYFIEKINQDGVTGLWLNRLDGGFTRDPHKAKKFETRHEAEDFRKQYPLTDCIVTEHIFMSPEPEAKIEEESQDKLWREAIEICDNIMPDETGSITALKSKFTITRNK